MTSAYFDIVTVPEKASGNILLVHGICGHAELWEEVQAHLAEAGLTSSAVSLRGHGGSDLDGAPLWRVRLEDYLDDLTRAWDRLGQQPLLLVGHSMGGALVQHWAGRHPERVRGLALVCTPGPRGPWRATWETLREDPLTLARVFLYRNTGKYIGTPEMCKRRFLTSDLTDEQVYEIWEDLGPESLLVYLDMLFRHPMPRIMVINQIPVMVIGAEADAVFHQWEVRELADAYSVQPVFLPGAHLSPLLEGSELLAAIISGWLHSSYTPPP